jgi:hypothetical protein
VVSNKPNIVAATVSGSTLRLELPSYQFGDVDLTVTATDGSGLSTPAPIDVTVTNTLDPPTVTGSLGPINVNEDAIIVRTLSDVFSDRDGDTLTYSVARLDNLINPTPQQIAAHPLVRTIEFVGDQMRILLQLNQFGTAEIEVAATDQTFSVSDNFTLTVSPLPDAPVAVADSYNVAIGSTLQVLDPQSGLLRNDFDVDGDSFTVDLTAITAPSKGTLSLVNPDGTFVYTSDAGVVGEVDSFTYRVIDSTGRVSAPVTVSISVTPSRYQNPTPGLREDVNADGRITAIDALRVINFLDRRLLDGTSNSVPVSEIGSAPPDFYDVSGNGAVSAQDALIVINRLGEINNASGESVASLAVTTGYASADASGLPVRNLEPVETPSEENTVDLLFAGQVEVASSSSEDAIEMLAGTEAKESSEPETSDEALFAFLSEVSVESDLIE